MTLHWNPGRLIRALLGAATLMAAGAGTYFVMQREPGIEPSHGPVLSMHASPRALPAIAFVDGAGKPKTLADFRGKTVLLNLWATWCAPCREEMPSLDRLQKKRGGSDFEVVALSIDASGAPAVERFFKENGIESLAVFVDSTMRAAGDLRTPGVPTTLLIDAEGRELGRHAGPASWDDPGVIGLISRHLPR